jgi:glucose-6-phosphate isomerase
MSVTPASSQSYAAAPDAAVWPSLTQAAAAMRARSTRSLFNADPERFAHNSATAAGLLYDYSRQRVDSKVLHDFATLADQLKLRERTAAMFRGDAINTTEGRAVLHTALRRPASAEALVVNGEDISKLVNDERARMLDFAERVRQGRIRGSGPNGSADGGAPFSLVVNIGIGGSDLGPAMAVEALRAFATGGPRIAFVSNVDGNQMADALDGADPARTLFIICSKTFTTQETRANADFARGWVRQCLGDAAVPQHFAAVSVNAKAMDAFGVHPDYRFAMWDWVGGRYSLWSSIGVALAIAIGAQHFDEFLAGGYAMDQHFQSAPWLHNAPVLSAMLGVWNRNLLELPTLAILPYDQRLSRFPAYLQQLEMESNGKSVRTDGRSAPLATCPVVWGEPGNMAQHSFFQLLHQGTPSVACDFLLPVESSCNNPAQQQLAIANCLAQAEAFAFGQSAPEGQPWRQYDGNRPSSLILFRRLDPHTLGTLVALYEHKVFVQSVLWGVNAFDQWGVELGKKLCEGIVPLVQGAGAAQSASQAALTSSLRGALAYVARKGLG